MIKRQKKKLQILLTSKNCRAAVCLDGEQHNGGGNSGGNGNSGGDGNNGSDVFAKRGFQNIFFQRPLRLT